MHCRQFKVCWEHVSWSFNEFANCLLNIFMFLDVFYGIFILIICLTQLANVYAMWLFINGMKSVRNHRFVLKTFNNCWLFREIPTNFVLQESSLWRCTSQLSSNPFSSSLLIAAAACSSTFCGHSFTCFSWQSFSDFTSIVWIPITVGSRKP